jgi:hypothetical protein
MKKTEVMTRVVDAKLIHQELLNSTAFKHSVKDLGSLPIYVIGPRSRPFYERESKLMPCVILLVNDDNVILRTFIFGAPTMALRMHVEQKLASVGQDYDDYLVCWVKSPGTLLPFRMVIPYDKDKIPVMLIEDPFALQAATHARFFLESTVIPAVFPGLAEYSARFGDVIYSFDEA